MTPEQQRSAIALACGYERRPDGAWRKVGMVGQCGIPNYLNDLNACHEAEKVLTHDQQGQFSVELGKLVTSHLPSNRAAWMDFLIAHATAAQRCEAFLKTLNLWTP